MAQFIARVQLHKDKDYTKLHGALDKLGFKRMMPGIDKGPELPLPEGVYYRCDKTELEPPRALARAIYLAAKDEDPEAKVVLVRASGKPDDIFSMGLLGKET